MENKSFSKGIFTISLDTEFAWGTDLKRVPKKEIQFEQEREMIEKILLLFGKYQISATWAIVGELFLENGVEDNSIWHAKDVVTKIRDFPVQQEIASHSFSHKDFRKISQEEAEQDLDQCIRIAKDLNIELKSFVFPYNNVRHLEVLNQKGFLCYRGRDDIWYKKIELLPSILKIFLNVLEEFLVITPSCSLPKKEEGKPLKIPGATPHLSVNSLVKFIPSKSRILRAKKGIEKAVREKKIFHLYFHPFDTASLPKRVLGEIEEILNYASQKRDEGKLDILSMIETYKFLKS